MVRLIKFLLLVAVLLVVGTVGTVAFAYMARSGPINGREVQNARTLVDDFSVVSVVPLRDGKVALIDAGYHEDAHVILRELERRHLNAGAVAAIFLTHGHSDHIGGVRQFPNAEVMALAEEVPLIEGRARARGPLHRWFPMHPTGITVTRPLRDGEVVTLSGMQFRVFAVPGHTAGSAAYLANGVLFIGDSADASTDGSLIGSPWILSESQADNRASLVRLEQKLTADHAEVMAIVPSHSAMMGGMDRLSAFAAAHR